MAHWRRTIAAALSHAGSGGEARAAGGEDLLLYRSTSPVDRGTLDFFVRGAQPGEPILFKLTVEASDEAALLAPPFGPELRADASGGAFLTIPAAEIPADSEGPIYLRAYAAREVRDGGRELVHSNFALVRRVPALYLIVESPRGSRVWRFDPRDRSLEPVAAGEVERDAALAANDERAFVERGVEIVQIEGDAASVRSPQGPEEDVLELGFTADGSALVALTRQPLAGGRVILRLRVLRSGDIREEVGRIDVLLGPSSLIGAWLVDGRSPHRVLVAEPGGLVREIVLGSELSRGATLAPVSATLGEELVGVKVLDERLVAVTRARGGVDRDGTGVSRIEVFDLRERTPPTSIPLSGRALEFELVRRLGLDSVAAVLDDGRVEIVALSGGARASIDLPGAVGIVRAPGEGRAWVLTSDRALERSFLHDVDLEGLQAGWIDLPPLSHLVGGLRTLQSGDRRWLAWVETRIRPGGPREAIVEDRLWCCEVGAEGDLRHDDATATELGGRVRRAASN